MKGGLSREDVLDNFKLVFEGAEADRILLDDLEVLPWRIPCRTAIMGYGYQDNP